MAPKRLPKLFLVRHGETEWTINGMYTPSTTTKSISINTVQGRFTGTSDIPLTANGESIIKQLGEKVAGPGKLINPHLLLDVMVSPRKRAQKTFELLFDNSKIKPGSIRTEQRVREWTYGDYEGLFVSEIVDIRKTKGLNGWDIWVDGCEGGESVVEMTARVDEVVKIVKDLHKGWVNGPARKEDDEGGDVLIVSHGHFSRCLLARWLGLPLEKGQLFALDPGGVCVMQYYHDLEHTSIGSMNLGLL